MAYEDGLRVEPHQIAYKMHAEFYMRPAGSHTEIICKSAEVTHRHHGRAHRLPDALARKLPHAGSARARRGVTCGIPHGSGCGIHPEFHLEPVWRTSFD